MARTDNLTNYLTDIANAIRTKGGTVGEINASQFDTAIANLPSGSGVETESGTFQPSENIQKPWVSFTNSHTNAPTLIMIVKTDDAALALGEAELWYYLDVSKLMGDIEIPRIVSGSNQPIYVLVYNLYLKQSSGSSASTGMTTKPSSDEGDSTAAYPKFFAKNNGFYCGIAGSTTSNWATYYSGCEYKWKAYWI